MGGHVVGAFEGVGVEGLAFADEAVEDGGEVGLDVGVGVFVEGEAGGGVFDEEVEQAGAGKGGQVTNDFLGDEVEAAAMGAEAELDLGGHRVRYTVNGGFRNERVRWCGVGSGG